MKKKRKARHRSAKILLACVVFAFSLALVAPVFRKHDEHAKARLDAMHQSFTSSSNYSDDDASDTIQTTSKTTTHKKEEDEDSDDDAEDVFVVVVGENARVEHGGRFNRRDCKTRRFD